MKLLMDNWEGTTYTNEEIESARVEDVEAFIRRLDQARHTTVSLEGPGKSVLIVGGGKGEYVVVATFDQEHWSTLQVGPRGGPTKLMNVGGQDGDYESDIVATYDQAFASARYWLQHAALDPTLTWRPH